MHLHALPARAVKAAGTAVWKKNMTNQTEIWKQTLYKTLEDADMTQTIVIVEDEDAPFRVVQLYHLRRHRRGSSSATRVPRAMYCRDTTCETREMAIQEARRLVAKCQMDQWQIFADEPTA
jgi:hypothetical protein